MNKIILDINDDVISAIEKIKEVDGVIVEVEIPEGSIVLDNITNLKLLERKASDFNKSLQFYTNDSIGRTLLSILKNEDEENAGFITKHVSLDSDEQDDDYKDYQEEKPKKSFSLPSFRLPSFNFKILIPLLIFIVLGGFAFSFFSTNTSANVSLVVRSQPLIKSFTINVDSERTTNIEQKVLRGSLKTAVVEESSEVKTTGELEEGTYAKGKIKIYNKTTEETDLKKGTEIKFEKLVYKTTTAVTVPAMTEITTNPEEPLLKPGEIEVEIEAEEYGAKYNIEKNETLTIGGYDDDEIYAKVSKDLEGGNSEKVKVVAKEDIEALSKALSPKLLEKSEELLKTKETTNDKYIVGSVETSISSENFSHKENEKTETLKLTQSATSKGLFYSRKELDSLVDKLVDDFVPEGFKLSTEKRDIKVEVLGKSESSDLNSTTADLQITLRTYVVPNIDEENLKNDLLGLDLKTAETKLSEIRNVINYAINLEGALPLSYFQKIPSNPDDITLEVKLDE